VPHHQIVRLFALRTVRVTATALLAGCLTTVVAGQSMNALRFDVTPADPVTYAIVCLLLTAAAAAGAYEPIRATAIDPIVALRHE
jgi:hypothetical protein